MVKFAAEEAKNERLQSLINLITDREKEIIVYRYGLYRNETKTQQEIADSFNISRSYISR